ncbi:hypothetical protein FACS1894184_19760 [Clostridia bacterium]|nr:hypothetical protein FACS1894184_19760 [Clostridia bacterium]
MAEEQTSTITEWHPPYVQAMEGTLVKYKDDLIITAESQLTMAPMKIDLVIVKKNPGVLIDNDIARIYKGVNICEYKSPSDGLTVYDYHKTIAYCHLYTVKERADFFDFTMSLVGSNHPRGLIKYLKEGCGYKVEEKYAGVYFVEGAALPIQIIETKRLSIETNPLLRGLNKDLTPGDLAKSLNCCNSISKEIDLGAYFKAVTEANAEALKGAANMFTLTPEWRSKLEETGWPKEWAETAREKARYDAAIEAIKDGVKKASTIAKIGDFSEERANELLRQYA